VLIPAHGIQGAALATVMAYGTSAVLVLLYVQARLGQNVLRLGLLTLPVVIACGCFLALDSLRFYLTAIPASAVSVFWLIRRFRLFTGEDAVFLKDVRVLAPFAPGAWTR
jgi:O-antigen/teichoic acid export membrane protein